MHGVAMRLCMVFAVLLASSCGSDKKPTEKPNEKPTEVDASLAGSSGSQQGQGGAAGKVEDSGTIPETCGNGIVDSDLEQCDDGNTDDNDGCTTMCTFTCSNDSDCDDLDICNGAETCNIETHTCLPGTLAEDGTRCGTAMSCQNGVCLEDSCGDGVLQQDEECDDGDNYDENDGCTTRCTFSCVADDETRNCTDACNPSSVCDQATHTCTPGNPLPDGTICDHEQGYCLNGVCVPSNCGDGIQEPNEECDEGERNGAPDSGCTGFCTLAICGDGIIGGNEHCDDGNTDNLDGCDFRCKAEVSFRGTAMGMSMDPAPDFCVHANSAKQGNAFANLFPDPTLINTTNDFMAQMMQNGEMLFLFHMMDVDNFTDIVPDPLVRAGTSVAVPQDLTSWLNTPNKLDFPVLVYREFYDDQLQPLSTTPSELVVENGRLVGRSTAPYSMGFEIQQSDMMNAGTFFMHDIMVRIEIGDSRSKMAPPPETIDSLLLPETIGGNDPLQAEGIMCGALAEESFAGMGLPQANVLGLPVPLEIFCLDQAGQYLSCAPGQDPLRGECSSVLDLLKGGCSDFAGTATFVAPIGEPDADVDGDGVNDAYTMVSKISAQRVKVVGFATGEPPARPIM